MALFINNASFYPMGFFLVIKSCFLFGIHIIIEISYIANSERKLGYGYNQGFGSVTFYLTDPDILYTDPSQKAIETSGKFIVNASDHSILELWRFVFKNVQ